MNKLEKYYNKFNEDKRLLSRHGQVEFFVCSHYINKIIGDRKNLKIIDIGAGTGRYSGYLADLGHDVTAVELVQKNVSQINDKNPNILVKQGNALNLKFKDNTFDIALVFGPLYHLFSTDDKLKAINEAKRVVKPGGQILLMYLMNDYAIITYAFKEENLKLCLDNNKINEDFQTITNEDDLYSYVRTEEINKLQQLSKLDRLQLIAVDGPTDYIRPIVNKMSENEFEIYKKYVLSISLRDDMIGASSHVLDILQKPKV